MAFCKQKNNVSLNQWYPHIWQISTTIKLADKIAEVAVTQSMSAVHSYRTLVTKLLEVSLQPDTITQVIPYQ